MAEYGESCISKIRFITNQFIYTVLVNTMKDSVYENNKPVFMISYNVVFFKNWSG